MDTNYTNMIKKCRFGIYTIRYKEGNDLIERQAIVLKDVETGLIIFFTEFSDYVLYRVYADTYAFRNDENTLLTICDFLNFVFIDHFEKYMISSIYDLQLQMFQDYLDQYARSVIGTKKPRHPNMNTLKAKRNAVSLFGEMLCYFHPDEMKYLKRFQLIGKTKRLKGKGYGEVSEYRLKVKCFEKDISGLIALHRDMPLGLANRFLDLAEIYDPELCLPIALQLYCGLREGEVCQVRRKESCLGEGVILTYIKIPNGSGKIDLIPQAMQIDLRHDYDLREDHVPVGRIKRKRIVSVYEPFLEKVYPYYRKHLELIKDKNCDDTYPMFLTENARRSDGKYSALTKAAYTKRVLKLFYDHVLPSCKNDKDKDLALFYLSMRDRSFGLHGFRHFFTVNLLLSGVNDVATLMSLRGDKKPMSAITYLQNKGALLKAQRKTIDSIGRTIKGEGITL